MSGRSAVLLLAAWLATGCEPTPAPPSAPVPLQFTGAESCRTCHASEYERWQASHHAQAMLPASAESVAGDFADSEFRYFDVVSRFFRDGSRFVVRTDNADGELEDFEVKYTFGVDPLQQYLVEMPGGHIQALPLAWDNRAANAGGQRWYHLYPDEAIGHDDPLHWTGREQNWNYMCAECHSTNLQKNYDSATFSFATTWSEINVACEACHGPASRHVARAQSGAGSGGLIVDLDDHGRAAWQMNAATGIAERSEPLMRAPQQPEACGRCHARRSLVTENYDYDRPLHDTHRPSLLDAPLYFADGQIQGEVYVYGSFLQSRMYRAGVTCSDCHDPHSGALKTASSPSDVCATCHLPARFAASEHHRHRPDDVACVDCHMPARTYMGVDQRRDHSFRVPRPALSQATASPNACIHCHDDRDAGWARDALQAWYGETSDAHYGLALQAGRTGQPQANALLRAASANVEYPGIARATALSLLRAPYSRETLQEIGQRLDDGDSLIRAAALGALSAAPQSLLLERAPPLLRDTVRSVRIEAARVLSPLQASLAGALAADFRTANGERLNAQLAIAERPEAHLNLGNLYADAGEFDRAEASFLHALTLEPRTTAATVNLAELYSATARQQEAENLLREGLVAGGDAAVLRHALGLLLVRVDRLDEAMAELAAAAELRADEPRFVYVYAVALNSTGNSAAAIERLQAATDRFPADFDLHWALVTMLRDAGRRDEARAVAARMDAAFPGNESVKSLLRAL